MTSRSAMCGNFEWITFDCYGTLIDWEKGILEAIGPFIERACRKPSAVELLSLYARLESEEEKTWRPYREVLERVADGLAKALGIELLPEERGFLVKSLPTWKPFPEADIALKMLKTYGFKLAIISNIDNDLLARTLRHFTVDFDLVVTAEEARCYKPYRKIFLLAAQKLAVSPSKILHVGQSLFHDIVPASALGWKTCWVKRPGRDPYGATPRASAEPDFIVSDLREIEKIARSV